ncbi:MAG: hypothetical protein SV186_04905 [Candidatus Nanohaloarchaea archaeon]|nr:hypothetical protein [Candidatus Nanohaloarchaea archaeon]
MLEDAHGVDVRSDRIEAKGSVLEGAEDVTVDARDITAWGVAENGSDIDINAGTLHTTHGLGRGMADATVTADTIAVKNDTFDRTSYGRAFTGVENTAITADTVASSSLLNRSSDSTLVADEVYADEIGERADSTLIAARELYTTPEPRTVRDYELPLTTADRHTELETDALLITPQDVDGSITYDGPWEQLREELQQLDPAGLSTDHLDLRERLDDSYDDPMGLQKDIERVRRIDQQLTEGTVTDDHDDDTYQVLAEVYDTDEETIAGLLNEKEAVVEDLFASPGSITSIEGTERGVAVATRNSMLTETEEQTITIDSIEASSILNDSSTTSVDASYLRAERRMFDDASELDIAADRIEGPRIGRRLTDSTVEAQYVGGDDAELFQRSAGIDLDADRIEGGDVLDNAWDVTVKVDDLRADSLGYWAEDVHIDAGTVEADQLYERAEDSSIEAGAVQADEVLNDARHTSLAADYLEASSIGDGAYNVVVAAQEFEGDMDGVSDETTVITPDDREGTIQYTGDWDRLTPALEQGVENKAFRMDPLTDRVFEDPDQLVDDMTALSVISQVSFAPGTPDDKGSHDALEEEYEEHPDTFTDAVTEPYGDDFANSLFVIDELFGDWTTFYQDHGDDLEEDDFDILDNLYKNIKNSDRIGRDRDEVADRMADVFLQYRDELKEWDRSARRGFTGAAIALEEVFDTDIDTYMGDRDEETVIEDLAVTEAVMQSARDADEEFSEAIDHYRDEFEATEDVFRALVTNEDEEWSEAPQNMAYIEDLTGANWREIVANGDGTVDGVRDELEIVAALGDAHDEYDRDVDDALGRVQAAYQEQHDDLARLVAEDKDSLLTALPLLGELDVDLDTAERWAEGRDAATVIDTLDLMHTGAGLVPEYTDEEATEKARKVMEDYREQLLGLDDELRRDVAKQLFNIPALLDKDLDDWLASGDYREDLDVVQALKAATHATDLDPDDARDAVAERYRATTDRTRELAREDPDLVEPMLQLETVTDTAWEQLVEQDDDALRRQARTVKELYDGKGYDTTDEEVQELYREHEDLLHGLVDDEEGRYLVRNATQLEEAAEMPIEEFIDTFQGGAPDDLTMAPEYGAEKLITTDGEVTDDVDEAATQAYQDGVATLERLARNAGRFAFELSTERQEDVLAEVVPEEAVDAIDVEAEEHVVAQIGEQIGQAYQDGDQELAEELKEAKHEYEERLDRAKRERAFDEVGLEYGDDPDYGDLDPGTVRDALDQFVQEYLDDCNIRQTAAQVSDSIVVDADVGGNAVEVSAWDKDLDTLPYKDRQVPCTFPGGMDSYEHNFLGYMADPETQVLTIETEEQSGAALLNRVEHDGDQYLFLHSVESDDGITASTGVSQAIDDALREYTRTVADDPDEPDVEGLIYSMDGHNSAARDFQDVVRRDDGFEEETIEVEKYGRHDLHFDGGYPDDPSVTAYVKEYGEL